MLPSSSCYLPPTSAATATRLSANGSRQQRFRSRRSSRADFLPERSDIRRPNASTERPGCHCTDVSGFAVGASQCRARNRRDRLVETAKIARKDEIPVRGEIKTSRPTPIVLLHSGTESGTIRDRR